MFTGINGILLLSFARGWGGAEEYLELLKDGLSERQIDCRILVKEGGAYSRRFHKREDIVQIPNGIRGFFRLSKRDFMQKGPDAIHVNRYYDILRGWYLKRLRPESILILYQHCYLNHPYYIPLLIPDWIICNSEFVKSSITERFPLLKDKISVINPGIDLEAFKIKKGDYRINGPVKIGMVGRFDKNQEELIFVAKELKKRGIGVRIHFAGSGKSDEEQRLRCLAEDTNLVNDVVFMGNIPHNRIASFYLDMDICASTMKKEGLSLAAMEAMACGLPFVAYNAPGFNELIQNGENGLLVDGGIREFASALEFFIKSMDIRKKTGKNAIKRAVQYFGIERNIDNYLNLLMDLHEKGSIG